MEMIKAKNTAYSKYEEVLLRRDNLRKEAEHYHMEYIRVFGDLITEAFEKKIDCIRKKKMIAYCQRQVNQGKKVEVGQLTAYISQEMAQYQDDLESMIRDVKAVRESRKVPASDMVKIKKSYHKLVKRIHPDMRPDLAEDETIREYWRRIVTAYTYNQLEELEELEVLVMTYLESAGYGGSDFEISNLDEKIAKIEEEIKSIISTNPYLYKQLLGDTEETLRRKQAYQDEIATYEMYAAKLDEVLATFEIEKGKLS